jgi:superfamily II DNA or RNA helicase
MIKKIYRDYSFQEDAIHCIKKDYYKKKNARMLLIIPTGGGKTLTAIRAVDEMIKDKVINENNKCLWITHLNSLERQTSEVVQSDKWKKEFDFSDKLQSFLNVKMKQEAIDLLENDINNEYGLVIIDECHHSSAKSYQQIFENPKLAILGLTATPNRSDKKTLNFDGPTYQITFDELEKRNVIIKPRPDKITIPLEIDADSLKSPRFDNSKRNNYIVSAILDRRRISRSKNNENYSKIVVYVNTVKHAKNLFDVFESRANIRELYDFVGFIEGGKNSSGCSNEDFLSNFKQSKSGIIINVNVLSEGFDDPSINTILMAVPTNSLIRYIQCVGRAIRVPEESNDIIPIIVECTEELPNIDYRITYGWLFADISDELEPILINHVIHPVPKLFSWIYTKEVKSFLNELFNDDNYNLRKYNFEDLKITDLSDISNSNIFLYWAGRDTSRLDDIRWRSIVIAPEDKPRFVEAYNRINSGIINGYSDRIIFDELYPELKELPYLNNQIKRYNLYFAMYMSHLDKQNAKQNNRLKYIIFKRDSYNESIFIRIKNFVKYFLKLILNKKGNKHV